MKNLQRDFYSLQSGKYKIIGIPVITCNKKGLCVGLNSAVNIYIIFHTQQKHFFYIQEQLSSHKNSLGSTLGGEGGRRDRRVPSPTHPITQNYMILSTVLWYLYTSSI